MAEKHPWLTLDNYPEYIERYKDSRQNQLVARAAHLLLAQRYRPTISFTHETDTRAEIRERIAAGERIFVGPNHLTGHDQYVIVSVAQRVKELRPLRGKTNIPAKAQIANDSHSIKRWGAEQLGARWVIRKKEIANQGIPYTPDVQLQHQAMLQLGEDADVDRMIAFAHGAGFIEGERNTDYYRIVQPPKIGLTQMLHRVAEVVPVSFLPMGFCYDTDKQNYLDKKRSVASPHNPTVHIGDLIPIDPDNVPQETNLVLREQMQYCVDEAVERYEARAA